MYAAGVSTPSAASIATMEAEPSLVPRACYYDARHRQFYCFTILPIHQLFQT